MTARKPAEPSCQSWIEQQIQQAQREGPFDDLPGAGRPLRTEDGADPNWWAKQEGLDADWRRRREESQRA